MESLFFFPHFLFDPIIATTPKTHQTLHQEICIWAIHGATNLKMMKMEKMQGIYDVLQEMVLLARFHVVGR